METNNKLRDAVEQIRDMLMSGGFGDRSPACIVNICDAALAEQVRNCDVGTADEQEVRFDGFCMAHKEIREQGLKVCSDNCPLVKKGFCDLHWAQMPYTEGGAK